MRRIGEKFPEAEEDDRVSDDLAVTLGILRTIRRMSQSDLAEAAGVTNSAISDYERGRVDPQSQTLRKLLRGLDLPVSILDQAQAFIETVRSQVGARVQGQPEPAPAVALDLPGEVGLDLKLRTEVALLASEGARFAARFIRLLFLVLAAPRGG
jgi:transcriptional regulator with XRE-family HTH domain